MLDPCSTGSYVSEDAAEELELCGQQLNLTIEGDRGNRDPETFPPCGTVSG